MSRSADTDRAEQLKTLVMVAKSATAAAMLFNAWSTDAGHTPHFSPDDLAAFRRLVHVSAFAARAVGVDLSDVVGPDVGVGAFRG